VLIDSDAGEEAEDPTPPAVNEVELIPDAMSVVSAATLSARESDEAQSAKAPAAQTVTHLIQRISALDDRQEVPRRSTGLKRKPSDADTGTTAAKRPAGSGSGSSSSSTMVDSTQRPSTSKNADDGKSSSRDAATSDLKERERQPETAPKKTVSSAKADVRDPKKGSTSSSARHADQTDDQASRSSAGEVSTRDDRRPGHRESAERSDKLAKTSTRQPSTSDRYDPETGRRVPEKSKSTSTTSDPPLILEPSTSDFDEDASLLERSRKLKSVASPVKSPAADQRKKPQKSGGDSDRKDSKNKDKGKGKAKDTQKRPPSPCIRLSLSREDNAAVQRFLEDRRRHAKR